MKHYYQHHYQNGDHYFSDRLIYSPNIIVLKSDDSIPQILDKTFCADAITCAAPYLKGCNKPDEELLAIYRSRIRNILEVAMSQEVDCLVLGAFGCGAFHNALKFMAEAFADLLIRENYAPFFQKVVFAIKRTGAHCRNLTAFQAAFSV